MRRGYREALPSFAVLALLGCGGVRVREQKVALELAWPPGQPRVRLERVIQQRSTSAPLVSWLSGSGSAPVFARSCFFSATVVAITVTTKLAQGTIGVVN